MKEKKVLVSNDKENIEKAVSVKRPRKSSKKPIITFAESPII